MGESLNQFLQNCFTMPVLPATALLILCLGYWGLVIIGAFDLDFFDFDLDTDVQPDSGLESAASAGLVVLRFFNLNDIPLMIWASVFSLGMWVISISMVLYKPVYQEDFWQGTQLVGLSAAGALVLTKLVTQPLRGKFGGKEPTHHEDLVGKEGVLITRATPENGQAEVKDQAAPLRIHVRTKQGALPKGERVRIIDYDPERRVFFIDLPKP